MAVQAGELDRIVEMLNYLRAGKPIGARDKYGLIRQAGGQARKVFGERVVGKTKEGPRSSIHSTWLVGTYGGGKSETLLQMQDALDENRFGNHKVVVCWADLNVDTTNSATGLHLALFRSASFLSPANTATATRKLASHLLGASSNPTKSSEAIIGLGIDIALAFLHTHAPGGGILGEKLYNAAWRAYCSRKDYLRRKIAGLALDDARATELMIHWVRYSLWPTDETWKDLNDYVEKLATDRDLFVVLTKVLKASGYASVVILVDQAEKLVGHPTLPDAFMNIYTSQEGAGLNVFFVFAGTAAIEALKAEVQYGGFARRFLDPVQSDSVIDNLTGPILRGRDNDINRIKTALNQIKLKYPNVPIPEFTADRMRSIRQRMANLNRERNVNWSMLWTAMLDS